MGSAARWRKTSAHHRSSGQQGWSKQRTRKNNGKGHTTQHIHCNAKNTRSIATSNLHYKLNMCIRKRCDKAPAKPRAAAREAGGTSPFPWCLFLQRCTFGWLLEKRLLLANVACLQCSVHAAGHRSGLSSICEAWEDSLLG